MYQRTCGRPCARNKRPQVLLFPAMKPDITAAMGKASLADGGAAANGNGAAA